MKSATFRAEDLALVRQCFRAGLPTEAIIKDPSLTEEIAAIAVAKRLLDGATPAYPVSFPDKAYNLLGFCSMMGCLLLGLDRQARRRVLVASGWQPLNGIGLKLAGLHLRTLH
jgi:hypothetical protein